MLKSNLKQNLRILLGVEPRIGIQAKMIKKWYGNTYGGFFIHPDILNEHSIVYSIGIGEDVSFDLDLIKNHNCEVFAYDPTPKAIEWISQQNILPGLHFFPYGIGARDCESIFYLPKNKSHISGSIIPTDVIDRQDKIIVQLFRLKTLMEMNGHSHIDVLKLDIEGAEYEVIEEILKSNVSIDQILVEFHHRFLIHGKRRTLQLLKLLNQNNYKVFGVSEQNSEVSLVRIKEA